MNQTTIKLEFPLADGQDSFILSLLERGLKRLFSDNSSCLLATYQVAKQVREECITENIWIKEIILPAIQNKIKELERGRKDKQT